MLGPTTAGKSAAGGFRLAEQCPIAGEAYVHRLDEFGADTADPARILAIDATGDRESRMLVSTVSGYPVTPRFVGVSATREVS